MTNFAARDLQATIQTWDTAAWSLAALALAARDDSPPELTTAAQQLLSATGLTGAPGNLLPGLHTSTPQQVASQAAAALHQASALASGRDISWSAHSDEALLAQGNASAQAARPFAQFVLPMMADLADRLAAPGACMLDIGTGVAALAVGFAQVFPQLHVLGIDILDRALDMGCQTIAASDVAARVTVRKQDIAGFTDDTGFDLAWLPAPFIPQSAMHSALPTGRGGAAPRRMAGPGARQIRRHPSRGRTHPAQDGRLRRHAAGRSGSMPPAPQGRADIGAADAHPSWAPAITIGQKPA